MMEQDTSVMETEQNKPSMLKRILRSRLLKVGVISLGLLTAFNSVYKVRQEEQVVITQLGKPVHVVLNPLDRGDENRGRLDEIKVDYEARGISYSEGAGLKVKLPFIQSVKRFDRRLIRWNGFPEQVPTRDKKYIWIDPTARWYIEDPLRFLETVATEAQAQSKLDDILDGATRNSITNRDLIEIVRTDNREMIIAEEELEDSTQVVEVKEGRTKIVDEINKEGRTECRRYGIGLCEENGILIRGLTYVDEVKEKVEDRMISERKRIAARYRSEGDGEYEKIMGEKVREVKRIMSEAYASARAIEGRADSLATLISAEGFVTEEGIRRDGFNSDPEFYAFSRKLQLYRDKVQPGTRMLLGTDSELFNLLKGNAKVKRE